MFFVATKHRDIHRVVAHAPPENTYCVSDLVGQQVTNLNDRAPGSLHVFEGYAGEVWSEGRFHDETNDVIGDEDGASVAPLHRDLDVGEANVASVAYPHARGRKGPEHAGLGVGDRKLRQGTGGRCGARARGEVHVIDGEPLDGVPRQT